MSRNFKLILESIGILALAVAVVIFVGPQGNRTSTDRTFNPELESVGAVTKYSRGKAFEGVTLYPATGTASVYLLDMQGATLHSWPLDANRARLLPNCNLLVVHGSKWGWRKEPWKSLRNTVREYDWDGNVVWEYRSIDIVHHDVQRLENGNTIFPIRAIIPDHLMPQITNPDRQKVKIRSDTLLEVDTNGEIAWEWHAHDHLDINSCGQRKCVAHLGQANAAKGLNDWTHINTLNLIPENKWYEAGDQRFKPGNIITIPRNWWTVLIIDRNSKEVVWKYTGDYKGGISGGHEAQMIPKGYPGEGNILIFDNGRKTHVGESYILEVDPVTQKVVWVYDVGKKLFSQSAGSVARLKNGNTFISEDNNGRSFEVNESKEIVWEFKGIHPSSRMSRYPKGYCPKL